MTLHLPTLPFLPTLWRRQPEPAPVWPGNPRTVADDLRISQANEAHLSRLLVVAQKDADIELQDSVSLRRRLTRIVTAYARCRTENTALRTANRSLQRQLEDAIYTPEQCAIIAAGGASKTAPTSAGATR